MKTTTSLFLMLFSIFYIVHYESYTWNPCGEFTCLAINCPIGGCRAPANTITCDDKDCVREALQKHGTAHLMGVFKIDLNNQKIEKLKVVESYDVKEDENYGSLTGTGTLSSDSILRLE